jgi:phosphatidate cytidylyltransferase
MKRILTAAVLIPLVLALVFLAPHWLFVLAVALVSIPAASECMGLAERSGFQPPRVAVTLAILALFGCHFFWPDATFIFFGILALLLLVYCTFARPVERVMGDASSAVFCLVYIGFTLVALPALHAESNGPSVLVFLLFVVWAGDITALYIGRSMGRHKLAPTLSPKKTWEGAIGSMVGSLLITAGLLALAHQVERWNFPILFYPDELWYWFVLAVFVNIAAQIGDLAESALKRSAGVKDSGTLLPGHGGVLDRIDALLLAAPVLWCAQVIHQMF